MRAHVALARELAGWITGSEDFELAVEPLLNLICFRHRGGDDLNMRLMEELNDGGKIYLTHTKLDSRVTLRLSIGQTNTERRHVEDAWRLIVETARRR